MSQNRFSMTVRPMMTEVVGLSPSRIKHMEKHWLLCVEICLLCLKEVIWICRRRHAIRIFGGEKLLSISRAGLSVYLWAVNTRFRRVAR